MSDFKEAVKKRRSIYTISSDTTIKDKEIQEILEFALMHVPSAFNSQSTRIALLLGEHHAKFWNIVKDTIKKMVPQDAFKKTEEKIDSCFACGYGTILFFEDQTVVKGLQEQFAAYAENFPKWSEHTAGMHQFTVWTMLEDAGLGATLQHYNPIIDEAVYKEWNIDRNWVLKAQMPFGLKKAEAEPKEFLPIEKRLKIFK
ncbi:putative oxidoreductase [Elusimicrobium minutum Pei191]|uniref:Putative oxidoreductase n=1 Tax=Elusimicrobium minutum (strain Pei191) TaxID=445932 RepID=B2KDH4_ELUMP|nr:nitroreductase family protein [Elusimicrobium minutum]ACC98570.1 putative oxidoreductase [Elusimicrobium minutum Pei191]